MLRGQHRKLQSLKLSKQSKKRRQLKWKWRLRLRKRRGKLKRRVNVMNKSELPYKPQQKRKQRGKLKKRVNARNKSGPQQKRKDSKRKRKSANWCLRLVRKSTDHLWLVRNSSLNERTSLASHNRLLTRLLSLIKSKTDRGEVLWNQSRKWNRDLP